MLNLKDQLAGKRIKCPDCQESILVPGSRPNGGNGNGAKKGGGMGMVLAVLGVGVVLVGCCCVGGVGGVGAWAFWPTGSSSGLEKKIVGKWAPDVEPPKKGAKLEDLMKQAFSGPIEFKADGTVFDGSPMTPILQGKWKTVSTKADVITVELSDGRNNNKLDIKVVSNDNLKITPLDSKTEYAFKRVN
jgi:hypothetical protein